MAMVAACKGPTSSASFDLLLDPGDRASCLEQLSRIQEELQNRDPGQTGGLAALSRDLLGIIGNTATADIVKEKAVQVLRELLRGCSSTSNEQDKDLLSWIGPFSRDYGTLLSERFGGTGDGGRTITNSSEHLRHLLVLVVSDLLSMRSSLRTTGSIDCLANAEEGASSILSEICNILARGAIGSSLLSDPYFSVHRESCRVILQLASQSPSAIGQNILNILPHLTGNQNTEASSPGSRFSDADGIAPRNNLALLSHRHSKTRCLALDTIAAVLCCCRSGDADGDASKQLEDLLTSARVLSCWEIIVTDRSAHVRESLYRAVGKVSSILVVEPSRRSCSSRSSCSNLPTVADRLVALLFVGASDDVETVKKAAAEALTSLTDLFESDPVFLRSHANPIASGLLQTVSESGSVDRILVARSLGALTLLLQVVRTLGSGSDNMVLPDNNAISTASTVFLKCLRDDRDDIREAAASCVLVVGGGKGPAPRIMLGTLIRLIEREDVDVYVLGFLELLLRGWVSRRKTISSDVSPDCWFDQRAAMEISSAICCDALLEAALLNKEMSRPLLLVCEALVTAVTGLPVDRPHSTDNAARAALLVSEDFATNLLVCILHLRENVSPSDHVEALIDRIAEIFHFSRTDTGNSRSTSLLRVHFRKVLEVLAPEGGVVGPRQLGAFEALLKCSGGSIIGDHFDIVGPIFTTSLCAQNGGGNKQSDTVQQGTHASFSSTKLSMMALLASLSSDRSFLPAGARDDDSQNDIITTIITDIVVPNLVWQAGAGQSAMRKLSLATLFSLLQGKRVNPCALLPVAPQIFPMLEALLSDDDETIRELTCHIIGALYMLSNDLAMGSNYQDILNCLEDVSDRVRIAACGALGELIPATSGPLRTAIVAKLKLHSKDPNVRAVVGDILNRST